MNKPLAELYLERGRLLERIAHQRVAVAQQLAPLQHAAEVGSRFLVMASQGVAFVKARPWVVALTVSILLIAKPRRVLPWVLRGVGLWRGWRALQAAIPPRVWAVASQLLQRQR